MNKTLMLVICDFLLLSMLALARFDPPEEAPEATLDATASSTTSEAELISLLEESLKAEQTDRSNLSEDLSETQEDLEAKARELAAREAALERTRQDLQAKSTEAEALAQTKAELEAEKARLAAEKAEIEQQRTELSQKFEQTRVELESANTERVELAKDIGSIKEESSVAKERLSATEDKLLARELALAEREAELKAAQEEAQRLAREREALNRALEVAKAESTLLQQNLSEEQAEKAALQAEKEAAFARAERLGQNVSELGENVSQLGQSVSSLDQNVASVSQNVSSVAENVSTVAQTSEAIQKEIIEARPQTMSEIFTRFQNNRATIEFSSREQAVLTGVTEKTYTSKSILLTDETGTHYLVTHSSDTPFNFSKSNTVLAVDLQVTLGSRSFPINQVGFLATDPRICFIPLPKQYVDGSGLETFELAMQPERWEEAILVKNDESNFGRTEFRRLTSSAKFLKMDRPALGELFADFASSKGDLSFTKNARFIGVMTDSKHAVVIDAFLASGALPLGANYNAVEAKTTIERLKDRLRKLPSEVR